MDRHYEWPFFEEAHRELARSAAKWTEKNLADLGESGDVDASCRELVQLLGCAGWLKYAVPAEYGGMRPGLDVRSICILREIFSRACMLADFVFALQGLGSGAITLFGSEKLRTAYLSRVSSGSAIAGFALSEPNAGSDVAGIATTARRKADSYVLDGVKTWISNGGIADFYVIFARTGEEARSRGLSAFVVDAGTPGLTVGERIELIAPHPMATLRLDSCRVSAERMLGPPGDGFKVAMRTLDVFRPSVAAAATGLARRALDEAVRHAKERKLFGQTLGEFQLTQAAIGDMATGIDAGALLTYRAAWLRDRDAPMTAEAAMAKMAATETAQAVVDRAVQLFGGLGVTKGTMVERLYREVRALRIYEGATEVQRLIVGRSLLAGAAERAT